MRTEPVGQILTDLATADPVRPAITCAGRTVSRMELESAANRLARAYEAIGVRRGDLVTLALPNGIEFYEACFAVWKLGAVPHLMSARLPQRERRQIIELAGPALVVGIEEALGGTPTIGPGYRPDPALGDEPLLPARVAPHWKVGTSGGSTGRPKLIVAGMTGAVDPDMGASMRMRPDEVQLVPGPLYHSSPFGYSMAGLLLGQQLVVLPRFDAADALAAIERHRVGWINLVPTMMLRMWRLIESSPGRYDLSTLRTVWHMSAPCPPWLKERWIDLVGADRLFELYGASEGLAETAISGTEWLAHRGSVGRVRRGELRIVGQAGEDVPPGTTGEIYMRAAANALGRYRYIGAMARQLADGWESFGDLGWMDPDGYLYLTDRRADMILVGGANVYPAEIESVLMEYPGVLSCAVIGLPDEDLGRRLHAVIQLESGAAPDEEAVRAFLAERVAKNKRPRSYRFVDTPLRDDAGKLRRSDVLERELLQHPTR